MSKADVKPVPRKAAASSLPHGTNSPRWIIGGVIVFLIGVVGLGSTGFLAYKFLEQEKREAAWTARLDSITNQIAKEERDLASLQANVSKIEPQLSERQSELSDVEGRVAAVRETLQGILKERDQVSAELEVASAQKSAAESNRDEFVKSYAKNVGKQRSLRASVAKLEKELAEAKTSLSNIQSDRDELGRLRASIEVSLERRAEVQAELAAASKTIGEKNARLEGLTATSEQLATANAVESALLSVTGDSIQQAEKNLSGLTQSVAKLETERDALEREIGNLKNARTVAQNSMNLAESETEGATAALTELSAKVKKLEARHASLLTVGAAEEANTQEASKTLSELRGQVEEARGRLAALQSQTSQRESENNAAPGSQ